MPQLNLRKKLYDTIIERKLDVTQWVNDLVEQELFNVKITRTENETVTETKRVKP